MRVQAPGLEMKFRIRSMNHPVQGTCNTILPTLAKVKTLLAG